MDSKKSIDQLILWLILWYREERITPNLLEVGNLCSLCTTENNLTKPSSFSTFFVKELLVGCFYSNFLIQAFELFKLSQ